MQSDPLEILIAHHDWANQLLLDSCAPLSHEQFHHPFPIGRGSLHNNIVHTLSATNAWTNMLMGRDSNQRFESDPPRSPDELLALHATTHEQLVIAARAKPLADLVHGERGGRSYTFTRGGVLTHVLTHAMHHRAQCLNMLRALGDASPPDISVVTWTLTKDANA